MKKKFRRSLFLFRRDLRLQDNTGLIFALKSSEAVIPAFIFTPEQIENNSYRSDHCLKFMLESLEDLEKQLAAKNAILFFFKGTVEQIVSQCIEELDINALIVNRDYTPYSVQRDKKIESLCRTNKITFHSFDDALLHSPEEVLKKDGTPYKVFTPYFRSASKQAVPPIAQNRAENYFHGPVSFALTKGNLPKINVENGLKGGRKAALDILKKLDSVECSSHLSPYLKFTVCSPREVYAAICSKLGSHHMLVRSLYWRDFFTSIAFFFPHVFKGAFHPKFDNLNWSNNKKAFQMWCEGRTGFPIVDAAMREMNATGFMPNRMRMIVASFLVKDLHLNWRWGEKYFAQTLIDYDPAVNNGNWQWVASTGCDAQPYFRIFNPWSQQKKFDRDCIYIRKWIPELRYVNPKAIHEWYKRAEDQIDYPSPMIDHTEEARVALQLFRKVM